MPGVRNEVDVVRSDASVLTTNWDIVRLQGRRVGSTLNERIRCERDGLRSGEETFRPL
jgi:hypothetical protein